MSLRRLWTTLNIKLNPCSTSQGHGSALRLRTSDMACRFLHCHQFGPILIGTDYLQACPWATGLLLGQLPCLPAREDGEWGAWEGPGRRAPHSAHLILCLGKQRNGAACVPAGPFPVGPPLCLSRLEWQEETEGGFFWLESLGNAGPVDDPGSGV